MAWTKPFGCIAVGSQLETQVLFRVAPSCITIVSGRNAHFQATAADTNLHASIWALRDPGGPGQAC